MRLAFLFSCSVAFVLKRHFGTNTNSEGTVLNKMILRCQPHQSDNLISIPKGWSQSRAVTPWNPNLPLETRSCEVLTLSSIYPDTHMRTHLQTDKRAFHQIPAVLKGCLLLHTALPNTINDWHLNYKSPKQPMGHFKGGKYSINVDCSWYKR